MLAARAGHKGIVQYLLENGALPHVKDKDGINAMILAIRAGRQDCAELLASALDQGYSHSSLDPHPLHILTCVLLLF
jgi:ankyrin repeat protein